MKIFKIKTELMLVQCAVLCMILLGIMLRADAQNAKVSRKEALIIAEGTPEAELLYKIYDGRLENCIDKEVIKPCESDWVTCIDNAWVVQFTISDVCQIKNDGRLGLTILIDGITGKVISRFPEAEYFRQENYCLEDYDCVCDQSDPAHISCSNFIFSQVKGNADMTCTSCQCVRNKCIFEDHSSRPDGAGKPKATRKK